MNKESNRDKLGIILMDAMKKVYSGSSHAEISLEYASLNLVITAMLKDMCEEMVDKFCGYLLKELSKENGFVELNLKWKKAYYAKSGEKKYNTTVKLLATSLKEVLIDCNTTK